MTDDFLAVKKQSVIRTIQNYTYPKNEVDAVVKALHSGFPFPSKLQEKFHFFTLDPSGTHLVYDGRRLVPTEEQDDVIAEAYDKTYAGINRLHAYLMASYLGVKQSRVTAWLARSPVQQQHRHQPPLGRSKPRIVNNLNDVWQVDLVHYKERFLLVVVDLWSKYLRLTTLANRESKTVASAVERMFSPAATPKTVSCDNGGEFQGAFAAMLQRNRIKLVYGHANNPTSQASVERLNRTIRMALERYNTAGGEDWRHFLRGWAEAYNDVKNLSTGFAPRVLQTASPAMKEKVALQRQKQVKRLATRRKRMRCCEDLGVGDLVRVRLLRKSGLEKKTLPEYSKDTYRVTKVLHSKYHWDEFKLTNRKVYRREYLLKIPEDTRPLPQRPHRIPVPAAPVPLSHATQAPEGLLCQFGFDSRMLLCTHTLENGMH